MQTSVAFAAKALPGALLLLHAVASAFAAANSVGAAAGCGGELFGAGVISPPRVPTTPAPNRQPGARGSSGASGPSLWGASGSDDGRVGQAAGGSGPSGAVGTSCTWNLAAIGGRSIYISFSTMKLQRNRDSLSIYAGDLLIATFTGNTLPPSMTLGSKARLVFRSDNTLKTRTFTALFMSRAPSCGGLLVASDRTNGSVITSPNHPNVYPNNADCSWTIVSPTTGRTRVQFTFVELENGNRDRLENGNRDRLVMYNGSDVLLRSISVTKPDVFNLGRTVFVRFTSNGSVQKRGFRAVVGRS